MKIDAEEISSEYDALSEHEGLLSPSSSLSEALSTSSWSEAELPVLHSSIVLTIKTKEIHRFLHFV